MPTGLPPGAGEECGRMVRRELLSQRRDGARKGSQICTAGLSGQALSTCVPSKLLTGCMRTVAAVAAAELVI